MSQPHPADPEEMLPQHVAMLADSAIAREVAFARGYRSVIHRGELEQLGFASRQARVPALLIPIWSVAGVVVLHQLRPDIPRMRDSKPVKYETPSGARMALDVPPGVRPMMGDPKLPLFVTEGVKKADSAVSHGLCCIALLGVWNWRGTNTKGGKVVLPDWESVALNDRAVYIVFDSDVMEKKEVYAALCRLKSFLELRGAHVSVIYLPAGTEGAKVGLDDYFVTGHTVQNLLALAADELRRPASTTRSTADGLPTVVVTNRALRDITKDAVNALVRANDPPVIFRRGGNLARVRADEHNAPLIDVLTESHLRGRLTRVANFFSVNNADTEQHVTPPLDVVRDVLALGSWPVPPLESVVEAPVLRPDGSVLDTEGYDAATRLVYVPTPDFVVPPIPAKPPTGALAAALALVKDEMLGEFPFVDDASRANYIALLLTPTMRPAIAGHSPLALLDKPGPGTGASLLAEIVSIVATGRRAAMMTAPCEDDEWRKKITSMLMTGASIIIIDNVKYALGSANLSAALTASIWEDRVLGRNKIIRVPQRATWMATGNNLRLAGDTARRSYWIRLDARMDRPWQRKEFHHKKLLTWVQQHRGDLLAALLILARGWYAAKCPKPKIEVPVIGGFETWAETVGAVLAYAGVAGFLTNLDALYEQIDEEATAWEGFFVALHEAYKDTPVTVAELVIAIRQEGSLLREALPGAVANALDAKNFAQRLGSALAERTDRVHGALRLERTSDDKHAKVARWRVRGLRGDAGTVSSNARARDEKAHTQESHRNGLKSSPQVPAVPAGEPPFEGEIP